MSLPILLHHYRWHLTAALLIGLLYAGHAAVFADYVADDGGISLAYARNLANGYGLALNPGGVPVEGYSNPLWVLLLAAALSLGPEALADEQLLKGLGLLFGLGTLLLLPVLARRAYGSGESVPWFAPTLLVVWTPFVFWAGGGLENALYSFVLVLAALLHFSELNGRVRLPWSAVALAAVAMTRPEGCAFFLVFLAHRVLVGRRNPGDQLPGLALWASVFVLLFGLFLIWRFHTFASWLPNTYYAKVWGRSLVDLPFYLVDFSDRGWMYLRGFARDAWPVLAVAALGLLDLRARPANLLFAGILGGQALSVMYVGGDWWPAWRFATPVLPFLSVAAQHGIHRAAAAAKRREPVTALAAVVVGIVAAQSLSASCQLRRLDREDRLIGLRGRRAQGERIRALAAAAHIEHPTYLEPDIGGPALTGGLTIVDLGMLTDIHLARFQYFPPAFRQYIFEERRPHFIRTHSTWTRSSRVTRYPEFTDQYLTISAHRDEYGLHGEFVRKDLFVSPSNGAAAASFGDIDLVDFEPRSLEASPGGRATFTWRWRCEQGCKQDYLLELILEDGRGASERMRFPAVFGWYSTKQWQPGEDVRVTHSFDVPLGMRPGKYDISVRPVSREPSPVPVQAGTLHIRSGHTAQPGAVPAALIQSSETSENTAPDGRREPSRLVARADRLLRGGDREAAFRALREALTQDPRNVRLTRRLEDLRERILWIEYYGRTRRFPQLLRTFDEAWSADSLPADRGRLEELYYRLLSAGDEERAGRVRELARVPETSAVTLYERGSPVVSLIDYWFELRELETMSRLHLFFRVQRMPTRDVDVLVHLESREGQRTTIDQPTLRATSRWRAGTIVSEEVILWPPPGEYDVAVQLARFDGSASLCTAPDGTACDIPLGRHRLGRE